MKVLYLTINPNRVSTTVPTEGWFRSLRPGGLEPVLVSNRAGAFHSWCLEQGIPAYEVALAFPSKTRPLPFLSAIIRLRKVVRRHGIQLIHCNEHDIYPIGQYLGRLCRLPVVVSVHFTMERGFCRWAFGGSRRPHRLIFTSRGNLEACRDAVEGIVPASHWLVLENGVDLDHYRLDAFRRERFRCTHKIPPAAPILGVACALRARKQLEHLIEAAARLDYPGLRVAVAGGPIPGDEAYAGSLLAEAQRRLGERLLYLGHLGDLRDFYNGLDVFVNTSQEEACSLSVIEAMACGLPIVGYPSKSVDSQILPDGGAVVPQDRIDLLAATLRGWLSEPGLLEAAREGARRQAEACFDIRRQANRLWREYQLVLAGPRSSTALPERRQVNEPSQVVG